jgi:hypothetical protein
VAVNETRSRRYVGREHNEERASLVARAAPIVNGGRNVARDSA